MSMIKVPHAEPAMPDDMAAEGILPKIMRFSSGKTYMEAAAITLCCIAPGCLLVPILCAGLIPIIITCLAILLICIYLFFAWIPLMINICVFFLWIITCVLSCLACPFSFGLSCLLIPLASIASLTTCYLVTVTAICFFSAITFLTYWTSMITVQWCFIIGFGSVIACPMMICAGSYACCSCFGRW